MAKTTVATPTHVAPQKRVPLATNRLMPAQEYDEAPAHGNQSEVLDTKIPTPWKGKSDTIEAQIH